MSVTLQTIFGTAAVGFMVLQPATSQACEEIRTAFQVAEPAQRDETSPVTLFGCTVDDIQMFQKNHGAVARAVPVETAEQLYGTWLGDDVLLPLLGVTAAGQEVLRISAGDGPGELKVEQFWMKAVLPGGQPFAWDNERGYTGVLAEGTLFAGVDPGMYFVADIPFRYHERAFEEERSEDLLVKLKLNYFEHPVRFSIDGETLVLGYKTFDPTGNDLADATVTYSRVADQAPDLALLTVISASMSQTQYFDCLSHQFSDGDGPFVRAIAPVTLDELREHYSALTDLNARTAALFDRSDAGEVGAALAAEVSELQQERLKLFDDPVNRQINKAMAGDDLGCPRLD